MTDANPWWRVEQHPGDAVAVRSADGAMTYAALRDQADAVGRRFGPTRQLVVLISRRSTGFVAAFLAALRGRHPVIITDDSAAPAVVDTYRPTLVVEPTGGADVHITRHIDAPPPDLHPDLAVLLSTSGSTGSAKLVRLSRSNMAANARAIVASLGMAPDDVGLTSLPLHYCYGLSVLTSHLAVGGAVSLTDLSVTEECLWDQVRDHRVTTIACVPYTLSLLERGGLDRLAGMSLRRLLHSGGKVPVDQVARFAESGSRDGWGMVLMYGQTEATARMAVLPARLAAEHPDAAGFAVPGSTIRVEPLPGAAGAGGDVPPSAGELVLRGPGVMMGYARTATDLARGADLDALRTGDLGTVDADGLIRIVGRLSRFAKVAGKRLDLADIESMCDAEGAPVIAVSGEATLDLVVADPDVATGRPGPAALSARARWVHALVAERCAVPRAAVRCLVVADLPRTGSGKLDTGAARTLLAEHGAQTPVLIPRQRTGSAAPPPPTSPGGNEGQGVPLGEIRAIFAGHLGRDDVADTDSFASLGGDSLAYVALSIDLEESVGSLPRDWQQCTVADLADRAAAHRDGVSESDAARSWWGRWWQWRDVDASVVLRAVAMVTIVVSHFKIFHLEGTAHPLLAAAGFNMARFHLNATTGTERVRRVLGAAGRIVLWTWPLIAVLWLVRDHYERSVLTYTYNFVATSSWSFSARFWFIEAVLWSTLAVAAVVALPGVRRLTGRHMYWVTMALIGVGLLARYGVLGEGMFHGAQGRFVTVWWFFAIGLAIGFASTRWDRVVLSVVAVVPSVGYYPSLVRDAVIAGLIVALIWFPVVRVPKGALPYIQAIAGASLYIYIIHWELLAPFAAISLSSLGVLASLALGVAYYRAVEAVPWRRLRSRLQWSRFVGAKQPSPTKGDHSIPAARRSHAESGVADTLLGLHHRPRDGATRSAHHGERPDGQGDADRREPSGARPRDE